MATIFAQSSARGKSGVAVFRLSGPKSMDILRSLTDANDFKPRYSTLVKLKYQGKIIDEAIAIYFQAPYSFTGEEVVELHTHGSLIVASLLTEIVLSLGARLALPGEFTKRAILNGKLDLLEAEGLMDLIEAQTLRQHKQATRQMSGELSAIYQGWRAQLLKIVSLFEAFIDFPEEEIPAAVLHEVQQKIVAITHDFTRYLNDNMRGQRIRSGIVVAIYGSPNVGKSTLINYLAKQEIAIVSDIAGTTRDAIEVQLDFGGYMTTFIDTAGIRDNASCAIEEEGIRRARVKVESADVRLLVKDANDSMDAEDEALCDLIILNKIDKLNQIDKEALDLKYQGKSYIAISLSERLHLDCLHKEILKAIERHLGGNDMSNEPCITRIRHRVSIQKAQEILIGVNIFNKDLVLIAEDIRAAARLLSGCINYIDTEEILGEIFSTFCIGK